MGAAFYLFMVKDINGPIGVAFRQLFGNLAEDQVVLILALMHVITLEMQLFFGPDVNLFTPFHKVLYLLLQVQGPIVTAEDAEIIHRKPSVGWGYDLRQRLETFLESCRILVIFWAVLAGVWFYLPPTNLPAVSLVDEFKMGSFNYASLRSVPSQGIAVGGSIGSCQWMGLMPGEFSKKTCEPFSLTLEEWHHCPKSGSSALLACNGSTSALENLRNGFAKSIRFRLTSRATTQLSEIPVQVTSTTEERMFSAGSQWSRELPFTINSRDQLLSLDDAYSARSTRLFFISDGSFYLLSSISFTGTFNDPVKLTGRVLWRGKVSPQRCANGDFTKLGLDNLSGVPKLRCSDGSEYELSFN